MRFKGTTFEEFLKEKELKIESGYTPEQTPRVQVAIRNNVETVPGAVAFGRDAKEALERLAQGVAGKMIAFDSGKVFFPPIIEVTDAAVEQVNDCLQQSGIDLE